eukprot:6481478-Pyramimonas_sp.AAC.1
MRTQIVFVVHMHQRHLSALCGAHHRSQNLIMRNVWTIGRSRPCRGACGGVGWNHNPGGSFGVHCDCGRLLGCCP